MVDYVGIGHHLKKAIEISDEREQKDVIDALKKILEDFQNNWKKVYEELEKLRQRIIDARKEPTYGLHRAQAPTMEKAKTWLKENGQLLEQII